MFPAGRGREGLGGNTQAELQQAGDSCSQKSGREFQQSKVNSATEMLERRAGNGQGSWPSAWLQVLASCVTFSKGFHLSESNFLIRQMERITILT